MNPPNSNFKIEAISQVKMEGDQSWELEIKEEIDEDYPLYPEVLDYHTNEQLQQIVKPSKKEKLWFYCASCPYKENHKWRLRQHVQSVHLRFKSYECRLCHHSTYKKSKLKFHINTVHLKTKPFCCKRCDFISFRKQDLENHMNSVHFGIESFVGSNFKDLTLTKSKLEILKVKKEARPEGLQLNLKIHKVKNLIKRKLDWTAIETNLELNKEKDDNQPKQMLTIVESSNTDIHNEVEDLLEPKLHWSRVESNQEILTKADPWHKPFACCLCDYRTAYVSSLKKHESKHREEKQSDYLPVYRRKDKVKSLKSLLQEVKPTSAEKLLICPYCDYTTSQQTHLDSHKIIAHTGHKNLVCPYCDYRKICKLHLKIANPYVPHENPLTTGEDKQRIKDEEIIVPELLPPPVNEVARPITIIPVGVGENSGSMPVVPLRDEDRIGVSDEIQLMASPCRKNKTSLDTALLLESVSDGVRDNRHLGQTLDSNGGRPSTPPGTQQQIQSQSVTVVVQPETLFEENPSSPPITHLDIIQTTIQDDARETDGNKEESTSRKEECQLNEGEEQLDGRNSGRGRGRPTRKKIKEEQHTEEVVTHNDDDQDDDNYLTNTKTLPEKPSIKENCDSGKLSNISPTELRHIKKKEQNKIAAVKFRQKRKAQREMLKQVERQLDEENTTLLKKVAQMKNEIGYLKSMMRNVYKAKGLIK